MKKIKITKLGMYNVIVKAVVFKKDKVLLLKRTKKDKFAAGEWDLPGGKLEYGEKPEEGLHREILEESGLKVKISSPFSIGYWYSNKEKVYKIAIDYVAEYKSGKVKKSDEHEIVEWQNINNIPKTITLWVRESITKAEKVRNVLRK
jgi:8-oxo-dGTP diphosphatase